MTAMPFEARMSIHISVQLDSIQCMSSSSADYGRASEMAAVRGWWARRDDRRKIYKRPNIYVMHRLTGFLFSCLASWNRTKFGSCRTFGNAENYDFCKYCCLSTVHWNGKGQLQHFQDLLHKYIFFDGNWAFRFSEPSEYKFIQVQNSNDGFSPFSQGFEFE